MIIEENKANLGRIEISPEVLEVIASIAVTETEGVHALHNNFASGNFEKIGKKYRGRGVKVDSKDKEVRLSIYVTLDQSHNVHGTAENIQKNVTQTIMNMTDNIVKEVNVHIVNIK
ncbi:Asp23/Gls24 family envelope stress response protein [Salinicoccus siamensis]|uniref:Asp23/Gls24 family envelope stress response protein n=1 Tax=Salinicoccus siamensis TaxID=381830 RepID=A0ABV5Z1G3_9STAP